jgi:hypothetical protein
MWIKWQKLTTLSEPLLEMAKIATATEQAGNANNKGFIDLNGSRLACRYAILPLSHAVSLFFRSEFSQLTQ